MSSERSHCTGEIQDALGSATGDDWVRFEHGDDEAPYWQLTIGSDVYWFADKRVACVDFCARGIGAETDPEVARRMALSLFV